MDHTRKVIKNETLKIWKQPMLNFITYFTIATHFASIIIIDSDPKCFQTFFTFNFRKPLGFTFAKNVLNNFHS